MMKEAFYINNRFLVDPASNLLTDKTAGKDTRLEPRLMELLCLLAAESGTTLTREALVATIWNDYGGGDEGLTQGISALRKLLGDADKELIQTIPKKGYCFKGQVSHPKERPGTPKVKRNRAWLALVPLAVAAVFFLTRKEQPGAQPPTLPYTRVAFPQDSGANDRSEENEHNTIVTTGPDSMVYRLVMIGDRPPRFYINDSLLPVHQWEPYMPLINQLKRQLKKKT